MVERVKSTQSIFLLARAHEHVSDTPTKSYDLQLIAYLYTQDEVQPHLNYSAYDAHYSAGSLSLRARLIVLHKLHAFFRPSNPTCYPLSGSGRPLIKV